MGVLALLFIAANAVPDLFRDLLEQPNISGMEATYYGFPLCVYTDYRNKPGLNVAALITNIIGGILLIGLAGLVWECFYRPFHLRLSTLIVMAVTAGALLLLNLRGQLQYTSMSERDGVRLAGWPFPVYPVEGYHFDPRDRRAPIEERVPTQAGPADPDEFDWSRLGLMLDLGVALFILAAAAGIAELLARRRSKVAADQLPSPGVHEP